MQQGALLANAEHCFRSYLPRAGQGHIRFWRMASTFTGLKLQGAIGKFGNVELSDVAAFVELPDGKVLSSTETGELLLWDGGLIKVRWRGAGLECGRWSSVIKRVALRRAWHGVAGGHSTHPS